MDARYQRRIGTSCTFQDSSRTCGARCRSLRRRSRRRDSRGRQLLHPYLATQVGAQFRLLPALDLGAERTRYLKNNAEGIERIRGGALRHRCRARGPPASVRHDGTLGHPRDHPCRRARARRRAARAAGVRPPRGHCRSARRGGCEGARAARSTHEADRRLGTAGGLARLGRRHAAKRSVSCMAARLVSPMSRSTLGFGPTRRGRTRPHPRAPRSISCTDSHRGTSAKRPARVRRSSRHAFATPWTGSDLPRPQWSRRRAHPTRRLRRRPRRVQSVLTQRRRRSIHCPRPRRIPARPGAPSRRVGVRGEGWRVAPSSKGCAPAPRPATRYCGFPACVTFAKSPAITTVIFDGSSVRRARR